MTGKGLIIRIIDWCALVATVGAAAALLCAFLAPVVNPGRVWIFAYAGLATPVLYLVNLFLMLYWVVRWKAAFSLPFLVLLIGLPKLDHYYQVGGSKSIGNGTTDAIKVLTYNVEGFLRYDAGRRVSSVRQISGMIREHAPDIVCLQEFQTTPAVPQAVVDTLFKEWKYHKIYQTSPNYGSAVYSKFPIVRSEILPVTGDRKGVLWVEMLVGGDTLRVVCNHLESTGIRNDDLAFLSPENFAGDPNKGGRIRRIAGRLRRGFRARALQADAIDSLRTTYNGPTLVCGDFNDPPMSYTYRKIRGKYNDTFEDKGDGYGYTYKKLYRLLRIDYILPSPHFETVSYESPDVPWSDHNPVIAVLRKNE